MIDKMGQEQVIKRAVTKRRKTVQRKTLNALYPNALIARSINYQQKLRNINMVQLPLQRE